MLCFVLAQLEIVDLAKGNFTAYVKTQKPTLIKFYAPWCGHCKNFAPKFIKLAELLDGAKFQLAQVDCTVQGDLCNEVNVHGYPTILLFQSGENIDEYNGQREPQNIKKWLEMFGK